MMAFTIVLHSLDVADTAPVKRAFQHRQVFPWEVQPRDKSSKALRMSVEDSERAADHSVAGLGF